jgi:hypothetical protein
MSRSILSQLRRAAWRTSSIAGDLQAAEQGPGAVVKRKARKAATRRTNRGLRKALRSIGL